jgi:hypothetical protein
MISKIFSIEIGCVFWTKRGVKGCFNGSDMKNSITIVNKSNSERSL